ncbi:DoxX family protein [Pelomonas sp. KK5]|uniref:DoxX family protein n=1 Tax=Pelomonas sp. KK5 TaxID=1855730 RepID=UPI0009FA6124|nr:DoxX family protein [Pelomonas sp. KK5]
MITGILRFFIDPGLGETTSDARVPGWIRTILSHLQSLALLASRLYVAQVFLLSGLTKIRDWSVTLALFQDEYHVPFLPPELAAYMGTAGELGLSSLLIIGLGTRFAAAGLTVVNIMAVLSLEEIAPAALMGHQLWGTLIVAIGLWGAGRWSADALIGLKLRGPSGGR